MQISRDDFESIVRDTVTSLPHRFRTYMENVAIVVEEEPDPELLRKNDVPPGNTLFGLYQGVPRSERGKRGNYGFVTPDRISIFQGPIQRHAGSPEELQKLVRETVLHEIAHHFGMGEERVRRMERERDR